MMSLEVAAVVATVAGCTSPVVVLITWPLGVTAVGAGETVGAGACTGVTVGLTVAVGWLAAAGVTAGVDEGGV